MHRLPIAWDEWGRLDGLDLAACIRRGDVSIPEVTAQAAAAILRVDHALDATLEVFAEPVPDPGTAPACGTSPLYGIPILLKDLAARLQGHRQENGSGLFHGQICDATDPFVDRLLHAGLIPIGRSTTAELGLAWDSSTNYLGQPKISRNPFDPRRTPGGSSGGSAAIVAAGAVPIATSSDGGGSTRIPASHCGLVGLKPTRGLCPRPFDSSEYQSRISTDGVVTRSVRDSAAVLDFTAHVEPGGAFMPVRSQAGRYLAALSSPRPRLRVGWNASAWGRSTPVPADITARLQRVAILLDDLDCELVEVDDSEIVDWPGLWDSYTINWMSARGQLSLLAAQRGLAADALQRLLTPMVYRMVEASARYDKADLWRMMSLNNRTTRAYGTLFRRIDVLLTPAYAAAVPLANGSSSSLHDEDVDAWFARQLDAARYAILCNEVGAPAITIPAGIGPDGLPAGVQLCGRWCDETLLLQLAADIERARPDWFGQIPPVHVSSAAG